MNIKKEISFVDRITLKNLEMAINEYNDTYGYEINVPKFKNCIASYLDDFTTGSDWSFNNSFREKSSTCFTKLFTNTEKFDTSTFWSFFGENYYPHF